VEQPDRILRAEHGAFAVGADERLRLRSTSPARDEGLSSACRRIRLTGDSSAAEPGDLSRPTVIDDRLSSGEPRPRDRARASWTGGRDAAERESRGAEWRWILTDTIVARSSRVLRGARSELPEQSQPGR
jgi:hypothetical protein